MRASINNLVIATGRCSVEWQNTDLYDAPFELPISMDVSLDQLIRAKDKINACAVAQNLSDREFSYFGVGRDVTHIGAYMEGTPVRLRYRSGELPAKFDRAMKQFYETGNLELSHLIRKNYILRPPTESQSLENKSKGNKEYKAKPEVKDKIKRAERAKKEKGSSYKPLYEGRGILHAKG